MSIFDIVAGAVLIFMLLRGLLRGGISELAGVGALIGGIGGGVLLMPKMGGFISANSDLAFPNLVGFIVAFLIIYVLVRIVGALLRQLLERMNLHSLDKAFGAFVGLIEGFLLILIALIVLLVQPVISFDALFEDSLFFSFFRPLLSFLLDIVKNRIIGG